jgi:amidase
MTKGWINMVVAIAAVALGGCETVPTSGVGRGVAALPATPAAGPAETAVLFARARAAEVEPRIHSIIALDPTAITQARAVDSAGRVGPLAGKPMLLKDNIESAGPLPTTAGSLALKDNVTGRDAPLVARLRGAGAIILGKSNLSEWANIRDTKSISGWSAVGGQTRNPYALDRNTCGSSSGSGAAVAAGIVDYAVGTETDGSITCPASLNGIVGLKPTVGLISRTYIVPISASQDTAGPMTRTVRQAAEMLTAMAGSDPRDKATVEADRRKTDYSAMLDAGSLRGKRIGVMRFASGFGTDEPFERALALLRAKGAILVEIKSFNDKAIGDNEFAVLMTELKAGMNAYLATTPPPVRTRTLADLIAFNRANAGVEMGLFKQELFELAQTKKVLSDPAYKKARRTSFRAAGPNGIDRLLRVHRLSALVGPTMPPAWKIDAVHGDQIDGGGAGSLAAVAGYPHLTVPMGQVRGLPVGLSFIGPKWSEALLLSLGFAYEQARGGLPGPRFLPSIEASPEIAPLLLPARR